MKKIFTIAGLVFGLLDCFCLEAVAYKARALKKGNNKLICCYVTHGDQRVLPKGIKQRAAIVEIAKKIHGHVIAEDITHYDGSNSKVQEYAKDFSQKMSKAESTIADKFDALFAELLPKLKHDTILSNIVQNCKEQNVSVFNVECRQIRQASENGYAVSGKDIVQTFNEAIKECNEELAIIEKNDDSAAKIIVHHCKSMLETIHATAKQYTSMLEQCPFTLKELTDKGYTIPGILWDRELVDVRMLINIYKHKSNPNIFICTGGAHLQRIESILGALGYSQTALTGKDYKSDDLDEKIKNAIDMSAFLDTLFATSTSQSNPSETKKLSEFIQEQDGRTNTLKKQLAFAKTYYEIQQKEYALTNTKLELVEKEYNAQMTDLKIIDESLIELTATIDAKAKEYTRLCDLLKLESTKNKEQIKKDVLKAHQEHKDAVTKNKTLRQKYKDLKKFVEDLKTKKEAITKQKETMVTDCGKIKEQHATLKSQLKALKNPQTLLSCISTQTEVAKKK